jgi:hypothetical protein
MSCENWTPDAAWWRKFDQLRVTVTAIHRGFTLLEGVVTVDEAHDLGLFMGMAARVAAMYQGTAGGDIASKMDEITASVWATATDLQGSTHERKTYRMILRDAGKETRIDLQIHADGTIVAVPYVPADYDYTDMDQEDEDEELPYYGDEDEDEEESEAHDERS